MRKVYPWKIYQARYSWLKMQSYLGNKVSRTWCRAAYLYSTGYCLLCCLSSWDSRWGAITEREADYTTPFPVQHKASPPPESCFSLLYCLMQFLCLMWGWCMVSNSSLDTLNHKMVMLHKIIPSGELLVDTVLALFLQICNKSIHA